MTRLLKCEGTELSTGAGAGCGFNPVLLRCSPLLMLGEGSRSGARMPTYELPEEAGSWAAGDPGLEGSKPGRCDTPTRTIGGLRSVR
jgi:hypothetical protein